MAKEAGFGQQLYVAGFDVSGDTGSVEGNIARNLLDGTAINVSAMERILGLASASISWSSFFNDAAGGTHVGLSALPTSDVDLMYATGTVAGDPAAMLRAKQVGYDGSRSADGGFLFSLVAQSSAGKSLEWGEMVSPGKVSHSSATNGAIWDSGAASPTGCMAQLQAFSCDSGTPTYILQDDTASDMSTAATYISFGAIAAGSHPTTVRAEESDACNRYRRIITTGTLSNAVHACAMREGASTDEEAYSG